MRSCVNVVGVLFLCCFFTKLKLFLFSSSLAFRMAISLNHFLLLFCFSVSPHPVSAVNSDGKTLLSLVRHWTVVPLPVRLSWRAFDFFPCSWIGVQCDRSNQLVAALALPGYGISGELGPEIAFLKHLKSIDLSMNSFSGSIPSSLGNCRLLEHLDLSANSFNGDIPKTLGNLHKLRYVNLQGNSLTGTIPDSFFSIPNLYSIYLNNNQVTGTIPSNIGDARKVLYLWLSGNQLTGSIPPSLGNCSALIDLRMEDNQLKGSIPSELGMLSQLQNMFLFSNNLTGEIPISIWKIQSLENLLVHRNDLSGEVPIEVTELMCLKNLSLHENKFTGVIPQDLGIRSSLVRVDFSYNQFTGHIPPHLCFRNQLTELNLGQHSFQGSIPSNVGSCSNLTRLILKENNLTGAIPDFVENSNLLFLDLSKNSLIGGIPSSLGNLKNLISVNLSMNKLSGQVAPALGTLVDLQTLDLSHNSLDGELPDQLSNCSKLLKLDVSDNLLYGSIPYSFRRLRELSTLSLSENGFTGDIPPFLFEFSKLSNLQLGGNTLGGKIPSSIGSSGDEQNLSLLNLSSNRLVGQVPIELRRLTMLEKLDISCNNLSGSLRVLDGIQQLVLINVSHNHFSGPMPSTLLKFLNSSPTSFAGNPELLVNCLSLDDLHCIQYSNLTSPLLPSKNKASHHKEEIIIAVVVTSSLNLALLLLQFYYMRVWNKETNEAKGYRTLLTEIMEATDNLSDGYIIRRGDQEIVYKVELSDGNSYALKKISFSGFEGVYSKGKKDIGLERIINEGEIGGSLYHQNIVRQEGYWIREDCGLILFSYMKEGSLHDVLHESNPPQSLEWNIRYKIALGTAQGLSYLHHDCNPPILHGDITSMNILLDDKLEPHISNFHLSKLCTNESRCSSEVIETVGYIAPEIAHRRCNWSDVYSYGVVLLELITGRKALDSSCNARYNMVQWVQSVWSEKEDIKCIVDPMLLDEFVDSAFAEHVTRVLKVALACMQKEPFNRPSMREVVKHLMDASSISFHQSTPFLLYKIMEATENLNDKYIIGRGAQGIVYKATLSSGMVYAVKKHQFVGNEGGNRSMIRELETIGKVHHPNLIRFEGFSFRDNYGLILYSFMENGSLHDVLHSKDCHQSRKPLEWNIRYQIAVGTAQGLSYLHFDCNPPILHGDIKSKNILLDSEFKPHIGDFGLAMPLDSYAASRSSHRIHGTVGYIAPENALKAKSKDSDVYAYGVVMLELITGRKAIDPSFHGEHNIVSWVQSVRSGRGEIKQVLDPSLLDRFFDSEVIEREVTSVLLLALSCTRKEWNKRPSMREVVNQLKGIRGEFEFSVLAGVLPSPPSPPTCNQQL